MSARVRAFLVDSGSGAVYKVHSPMLAAGAHDLAQGYVALRASTEAPARGSRRLKDRIGHVIGGVSCAGRPFDLALYAYAAAVNTYHARAVRAKAKDVAGRAWRVVGAGPEALRRKIESFLRYGFSRLSFSEGLMQVWSDREALGNGYLEVVPSMAGEPIELAHLPASEMWIRMDELGYVQWKNGEAAHFRDALLPLERYGHLPATDPLHPDRTVTSVIHFARHGSWSPYYGVPSIMPAWNALTLMVLIAEYNLQFFGNNAIPDYAVVLEGEADDAVEETIRTYFQTHLKGKAHKTLVLTTPAGSKIRFEKLTDAGAREGSFRLLRTDCRDEILAAHGIPPQKVGIVETGKLGGNLASEQIFEYQLSIVGPGQEQICGRFNRLFARWFGTEEFSLQMDGLDIDDRKINADIDAIYLDRNVLVPNDVRSERFPALPPLPGGDDPLRPATLADLAALEDQLGQIQRLIRGGE